MTIQEIAANLKRYDEFPGAELPECFACYNTALSDIEAGELGDAKKDLKKALRENPEFDDGNVLMSLVLFAMGNRIECMRRINEINDGEKRDLAMDYVDSLSSNGRRRQKAVESETDEERQKRVEEEKAAVNVQVAKPEEASDELQASKNDENFKKRYRKAKKARDEELQNTDADVIDETSMAATRISTAPAAATVVIGGFAENPTEKEDEGTGAKTQEVPEGLDNGEPAADRQAEPEEPVTFVFDFEKMFDTGYTERNVADEETETEAPAEAEITGVAFTETEPSEPDGEADGEPENDPDEKYVNDELMKPESRLRAILKIAAAAAALALIALIAFKLSL